MLYCEKCRSICPDTTPKCPVCKSGKLRAVDDGDMVRLHRADQYTAERLTGRFDEAGIAYEEKPFGRAGVSYLYDSEVMPTDREIFVRYGDLEAAKAFSAKLREELEQEQAAEDGEEFEEMPRKKRMVVQAVSVILFLLLVMATVFAADALAGWLKGLFGM